MTLEQKIRRVRTPEGAEMYGQPIGSIIVADAVPGRRQSIRLPKAEGAKPKRSNRRAKNSTGREIRKRGVPSLNPVASPYKGWDGFEHEDTGDVYYIGKDPDPKKDRYVAVDPSGKVIVQSRNRGDVVIALRQQTGTYKVQEERADYSYMSGQGDDESDADFNARVKAWEKKFGVVFPPGATQVEFTMDESKQKIGRYIYVDGSTRNIPNKNWAEDHDDQKWVRVQTLQESLPKLLKGLPEEAMENDTAASVLLMQVTGMRADASNKQRGSVEIFGATTLLNSHVSFGEDESGRPTVSFEFIQKGGKPYVRTFHEPVLVKAIKAHHNPDDPDGYLFPSTNASKTQDFIEKKVGKGVRFKNHDLRTLRATRHARMLVERALKRGQVPLNTKQLAQMKTDIAKQVADSLGNTPSVALNSYIDPKVFVEWNDAPMKNK